MFATIYLPNFYLQAVLRHQTKLRGQPVALIDTAEIKVNIIELNDVAEIAGIRKGMTPSQALARCLSVVIKTRERAQENVIAEILLQYAFMLSPWVEATALGVCTVQLSHRDPADDSSAAHQYYPKVSRVIEKLNHCGITAQAGIAPLPDASFFAAHLARPVLHVEKVKDFLDPLPIETLTFA